MTTLEEVIEIHKELCDEARAIIKIKGRDYNREQQNGGDTLFNMSVSSLLGITKTVTQGILVRISDKFMRLISLTKYPTETPAVKDESVKDTIKDMINYLVYLYIKYKEDQAVISDEDKEQLMKLGEKMANEAKKK
jgi:hypothetical protein